MLAHQLIYEVIPLICPRCVHEMRIKSLRQHPRLHRRILSHIGELTTLPAIAPVHCPPLWEFALDQIPGHNFDTTNLVPEFE